MGISDNANRYLTDKVAGMHTILLDFAGIVESEAKRNANPRYWKTNTNHATQALHAGVEGRGRDLTLYLSHGVKYGKYLEEGTPPHVIKPKKKPFLQFRVNGQFVRTKKVNHPGTKPRPLLEDTLRGNKARLERNIINWWSNE
jgi:hypothetical protein